MLPEHLRPRIIMTREEPPAVLDFPWWVTWLVWGVAVAVAAGVVLR